MKDRSCCKLLVLIKENLFVILRLCYNFLHFLKVSYRISKDFIHSRPFLLQINARLPPGGVFLTFIKEPHTLLCIYAKWCYIPLKRLLAIGLRTSHFLIYYC